MARLSPGVVIYQPSNSRPLDAEGALKFFGMIFKASDFHVEVTGMIGEGDKGVSVERVTGTWNGPYTDPETGKTTPGNGRKLDHPGDGAGLSARSQNHRVDSYWDRLTVQQQLEEKQMKRHLCMTLVVSLALVTNARANDEVTPIDPATGKVLVAPGDSILSEDVPAGPPNSNPPPYTLIRYTERYDYLANPANRTDFFDPIKYIPLDAQDSESYLSLSGELRERFEHYYNQAFGVHGPDVNNYDLQRITLGADLHVNERLRAFVQGISGLQFGGAEPKPPVQQDPVDLQQAFADYTFGNPTPDGTRFTVRGGRFEMTYGSGRLIATRAAPNIPFKFDGAQFIASTNGDTKLYGFVTHPVAENRIKFDSADQGQGLWGLYGVAPMGGPLHTTLDLYYLGFRNEDAVYADGAGTELRHTLGARFSGKTHGFDYDIEPVGQFGTFGDRDIRAWTLAADGGYTFAGIAWKPRLGAKFDIASGDRNKGDRVLGSFNPLFFKAGYFNDASLIRPSNIIDIHPSLQLQPSKAVTLTFGNDTLWRDSTHDAIYGPSGGIFLPAAPGSFYVGTTAEAAVQWKLDRHVVWSGSYVHMFTGDYVSHSGGGDVDYVASWISYLF